MAPLSQNYENKYKNSDISTTFAPLGVLWVSKEAENLKELDFVGLGRYFSVKIEKSSKNLQKRMKCMKITTFFSGFSKFIQFRLKNSAPNQ